MPEYARRLRKLRGEKKQSEIAENLGIPLTTYASYEQGVRIPKDRMKVLIAAHFGVSVTDIFFTD